MRHVFALLLVSGLSGSAMADAPRPVPVPKATPVPLSAYGTQNAQCLEWTDGCLVCRAEVAGVARCSTPGIACQPGGVMCKVKR